MPETQTPGNPVTTQKIYPNARIHIQGDKLFLMWDVLKPGIMGKIDHVAYMVVEGDKFVEKGYGESFADKEAQPLLSLGSAYRPRVESWVMNIVNNLVQSQQDLAPYAAWQIDMAQRDWSISEDYPHEDMLVHWIPSDTADNKLKYQQLQLGDKNRSLAELSAFNTQLSKELNLLRQGAAQAIVDIGTSTAAQK